MSAAARGVRGAIDCNSNISAFKGGSVIDTIAGHAAFEAHQAEGGVSGSVSQATGELFIALIMGAL